MSDPARTRSVSRNLTGWLIGFGASILADQVFFLSLTWAALQVGTPGQVGLVLAAGSVPRLLILLVGGAFADQASPKRIIVGTDTGRAVVMALAATVLMLGSMNTWGLVVVALAIGALDGLFLPAVGALPARIAPPELMGRIAALRTVTQRAAMLLGGPLAGWLIYLYGASAAFWGSAILFAVSVGALALVSTLAPVSRPESPVLPIDEAVADPKVGSAPPLAITPESTSAEPDAIATDAISTDNGATAEEDTAREGAVRGVLARIVGGLRVVRHDPVLPWLLLLIAGMNFGFAGPVTAGLPLLADAASWGARGAGLLLGAFGFGAMVTGLGLVFVRRIPRAGWVGMAGVGTMGLALTAIGFSTSLTFALTCAVVLGLASGVFGTVVHAMVLTSTPQAEIGRVMGLVSLSVEGVVPISFAATGALAGLLGAEATFVAGGLVILASTLLAFSRSRLRAFQLPRGPGQDRQPSGTAPLSPAS